MLVSLLIGDSIMHEDVFTTIMLILIFILLIVVAFISFKEKRMGKKIEKIV